MKPLEPRPFSGGEPHADLPPEAPLAMPVRDFDACHVAPAVPDTSPPDIEDRRFGLLLGAVFLTLLASGQMAGIAAGNGLTWREAALLLVFCPLFGWIAFAFVSALAGFVALLRGDGGGALAIETRAPAQRTAVLVPIYNEDVEAVLDRVARMRRSIDALGHARLFDFFLLSDTTDAAILRRERPAFLRVRGEAGPALYYRHRRKNIDRKPGNVAEWIGRFGADYPQMLVLDADSLMTGDAMARLAATLEANPGVGLIQSLPVVAGSRTLFARWQQFAARLYSPVSAAGLLWWSGAEAMFWGHNAIVRTTAFAGCCGLPKLSGPEPFGGAVLSHDLVEAAMLRRCGWAVHMVELPGGSFEEFPPTAIDHAIRDRRWCQGNLQHLRLLDAKGFHWISRLQLLMGGSAYLTSPLWLLLLAAGAIQQVEAGGAMWFNAPELGWVFSLTLLLLFGPKLLSVAWVLIDRTRRRQFGGGERVVASAVIEAPLAMLLAPMVMITQTLMLIDILRGRNSGWAAQRRDAAGIGMREALLFYRAHVLTGLVMLLVSVLTPHQFVWMVPVAIGLVAAPLLAVLTARRDIGLKLLDEELFLTPEEWAALRVRYPAMRAALTAEHAAIWERLQKAA